jgi:exopolysaccharide biosynthesis polyprenyl glycosylphosphotransferase
MLHDQRELTTLPLYNARELRLLGETGARPGPRVLDEATDAGDEASASSHRDTSTRKHRIPEWLLGQGTWPFILVADLAALGAATLLTDPLTRPASIATATALSVFALIGLYRSRLTMSALDDFPRLLAGILMAMIVMLGTTAVMNRAHPVTSVAGNVIIFGAAALTFVALARAAAYLIVRIMRQRGIAHHTVVVGAGRVGQSVASVLDEHREYGLSPIGFVDSHPLRQSTDYDLPILGGQAAIPFILRETGARNVIIAFAAAREESMIDVIRECDRLDCEIFIVPRMFEVQHVGSDMDSVWGIPLIRLRRGAHRAFSWKLKRLFDVLASSLALLLLAPLMAIIALAVRLDGGRGVLFRQIRVGFDGQHFELLKFRSLRPVDESESSTMWNISHDDRLGPIGRLLRKSSLDELPQLLNILRGDMSVVGPRPERPHFATQFRHVYPRYWARHRVPCGLTGWAQIHGLRGDTSISDRAKFDNYYVENWSLWLDAKIIVRTAGAVFTRAGS